MHHQFTELADVDITRQRWSAQTGACRAPVAATAYAVVASARGTIRVD